MTERAKHAARIRDERHTDQRERTGNRKNTKRWCRGVVGREHKYERIERVYYGRFVTRVDKCAACGREEWVFK